LRRNVPQIQRRQTTQKPYSQQTCNDIYVHGTIPLSSEIVFSKIVPRVAESFQGFPI
jgi:hypothetical protein